MPWQIFVKTLNGSTVTIDAHPEMMVKDVHHALGTKESLPVHDQRLIFGGKQLQWDRFLSDYGIYKNSTLHLALRLSGGVWHINRI